jgi:3-oxoacyl-[acyl-carrier protein] reductase
VQPGLHATGRVRSVYGDGADGRLADALTTVPAGRLGDPDGLGALVAFLCSQQAEYLTGAAIPVDGGAYQALL